MRPYAALVGERPAVDFVIAAAAAARETATDNTGMYKKHRPGRGTADSRRWTFRSGGNSDNSWPPRLTTIRCPPMPDPSNPVSPIYFDALHIGRPTETDWHEMTREAIIAFAREYDPQPFHLTDAGGEASAFGRLVASGLHTFSVFNKLRVAAEPGLAITAGLGLEKLRFMVPVEPGDRLQVRGAVFDKRPAVLEPDR
jgi:acyl dehydratase